MHKFLKWWINWQNLILTNTNEFISQIEKIGYNEDLGLCKFILVGCLVDAVAAYAYQKKNNN